MDKFTPFWGRVLYSVFAESLCFLNGAGNTVVPLRQDILYSGYPSRKDALLEKMQFFVSEYWECMCMMWCSLSPKDTFLMRTELLWHRRGVPIREGLLYRYLLLLADAVDLIAKQIHMYIILKPSIVSVKTTFWNVGTMCIGFRTKFISHL